VGKRDVFVQRRSSARIFSVPKSRCVKVPTDKSPASDTVLTPKLGNLVLSMTDRFGRVDRKLGVLVEMIDVPGDYLMAKILMGEKSELVLFKSLIVVE